MTMYSGACPFCGASINVMDDIPQQRCPVCDQAFNTAAAIGGAAGQTNPQATLPAPNQLLEQWKTQAGPTAGGVIIAIVISVAAQALPATAALIIALALSAAYIVYAAAVYPKYFSANPPQMSNTSISFLNGLCGGLIFGLLWNYNMTKRTQGISYIVYIVIQALAVLSNITLLFL